MSHFYKFVELLEPDYIMVENVPNIINKDVFKNFVKNLKNKGYHVSYASLGCSNYGLPQARYRLVLIASKEGEINLPTPNNKELNTVKNAIGDLEPLIAGQVSKNDPLHRCRNLADINLKRIRQSKPSGTWQDWDCNLLPECYKRKSGASYKSVYGRMSWDKPSPTITTQAFSYGSGRYGHPEQDRALSLREMATLQTFPKCYKFFKKTSDITYKIAGRLIGNAVPVELARLIGVEIVKFNSKENFKPTKKVA